MHIKVFHDFQALTPYQARWNELAAQVPFRTWQWNHTWWQHYGNRHELAVIGVFDGDHLVGIAPWYIFRSILHGRVTTFLGGGEVCSEYASILAEPGREEAVAAAIAQRIASEPNVLSCDQLYFDAVAADDVSVSALMAILAEREFTVQQRPGAQCWRLQLPSCWEDYLATVSKSHRKQLRRGDKRMLEAGRASLTTVSAPQELEHAFSTLVDLHQQRWNSHGQPGCFASELFLGFHQDIASQFLDNGWLRLHILKIDDQPAAAEYHFALGDVIYAYQSGVDPEKTDLEPGRLAAISFLRSAIDQKFSAVDFLRGDEPYKAHYRAVPREVVQYRAVRRRMVSQLRFRIWSSANQLREAVLPRASAASAPTGDNESPG